MVYTKHIDVHRGHQCLGCHGVWLLKNKNPCMRVVYDSKNRAIESGMVWQDVN